MAQSRLTTLDNIAKTLYKVLRYQPLQTDEIEQLLDRHLAEEGGFAIINRVKQFASDQNVELKKKAKQVRKKDRFNRVEKNDSIISEVDNAIARQNMDALELFTYLMSDNRSPDTKDNFIDLLFHRQDRKKLLTTTIDLIKTQIHKLTEPHLKAIWNENIFDKNTYAARLARLQKCLDCTHLAFCRIYPTQHRLLAYLRLPDRSLACKAKVLGVFNTNPAGKRLLHKAKDLLKEIDDNDFWHPDTNLVRGLINTIDEMISPGVQITRMSKSF